LHSFLPGLLHSITPCPQLIFYSPNTRHPVYDKNKNNFQAINEVTGTANKFFFNNKSCQFRVDDRLLGNPLSLHNGMKPMLEKQTYKC
jgi:hypothetical protein